MKFKPFFLPFLIIATLFLSACVAKQPSTETSTGEDISGEPSKSKGQTTTLTEVLTAVGVASDLSDPMKMRIRRKVDDIYLNDEGEGFSLRSSSEDPVLTDKTEAIDKTLEDLGFSAKEEKPKNPQSFVIKFVKYRQANIECTLEIRKVGTTGNSELAFGCLK